jgi:hypothetical protein
VNIKQDDGTTVSVDINRAVDAIFEMIDLPALSTERLVQLFNVLETEYVNRLAETYSNEGAG